MRLSPIYTVLCLSLLFCWSIAFQSCDDECLNISCANNAACVDGSCECPYGYIGEFCQYATCALAYCSINAECVMVDSTATCVCNCGYTGVYCESELRTDLYGSYTAADPCHTQAYDITIDNISVSARPQRFRINGWGGFTDPTIEVFGEICTPTEWTLRDTVFADPATSGIVSITATEVGTITRSANDIQQLGISYVIVTPQDTQTCEVVFSPN